MEKIIDSIKTRHQRIGQYYEGEKQNIRHSNVRLLQLLSIVGFVMILVFFLITPIIFPKWRVSGVYIVFLIFMAIFAILSNTLLKAREQSRAWVLIFAYSFIIGIMLFVIVLDTALFPHAAATFSPVFLVVAPVVFIEAFAPMIVFQTGYLVVFSFATTYFKNITVSRADVFSAVFAYIVSILLYNIVMDLRVRDYIQKVDYRISSEIDSLTGIPNRATSKSRIEHYLAMKENSSCCAMIVLDVDNFKQVNDRFGHSNGDVVLREVAQTLRKVFRASDIVGRFGGDEFLIFVKDIYDTTFLEEKCQEINQRTAGILTGKMRISCSMGVAFLKSETATLEELFHVADNAVYEAKSFGKGTYVIHNFKHQEMTEEKQSYMVIVDDNLVVTVSSDAESETQALECGAADMIVKPIVPSVTKLRVHNAIGKH